MILQVLLAAATGAGLGFGREKTGGCSTGASPLTGEPVSGTIPGALAGTLLATRLR